MKLSKMQEAFVNAVVEANDQQYNSIQKDLLDIIKKGTKDRKDFIKLIGERVLEVNLVDGKVSLSRSKINEMLKEFTQKINKIVEKEVKQDTKETENLLMNVAENRGKYHDYMLEMGLNFNIQPLAKEELKKVVNSNILHEIWSDNLWTNKQVMGNRLNYLVNDFLLGRVSVVDIRKKIMQEFEADNYNTKRLVNTEVARVQQGVIDAVGDKYGIKKQIYMATLDKKTCKKCGNHDGKIYEKKSKNRPHVPLHPNCRCVMSDVVETYEPKRRRNNETKESIDYVTYNDWIKSMKNN